ncbi:hypothetical protein [Streptomyces sp. UNOC14_S4]|uniref:hypothetical protein n=1 Tax=Streptomyces sp. UNOC14_S4 TaxID=2872340 RepID=UPI001E351092|nr:hypothetical protein [Streptomyces sp. UNOC14_S4]MCC3766467.1 hypothetical protein [Streptomyces sp. UNOC14_S4]
MSNPNFQTCWSEATPGETHGTWSGDKTACHLSVIEAKPEHESKLSDVTCALCGAELLFDLEGARKAAREFVRSHPAAVKLDEAAIYSFGGDLAEKAAGVAWEIQRKYGSWNSNHAFSEFMAGGGWMTEKTPEARLIGLTAIAVLEFLAAAE